MSSALSPSSFFILEQFTHAALFDGCVYVWETLERLSAYLKEQKLGKIEVDLPSSVHLVNPSLISIGSGTVVEPGAYIQGPCIIGNNCQIRHGAYIRGDLISQEKLVSLVMIRKLNIPFCSIVPMLPILIMLAIPF